MRTFHVLSTLLIACFIAAPIAGCAGTRTTESTGEYVDDSVLSNKVRAKLAGDKDLNLFQINVTSFKGAVQLSGFVNNAAAKERATQVVSSIEGVKAVHNDLVIK